MAAVGSVAFGIGRVFVLDSSIASLYENGTVAYYAAESGIEEGLLRYRFNQNATVPANNDNVDLSKYFRRDLTATSVSSTVVDSSDIVTDQNKPSFDVAMKYKYSYYGHDTNTNSFLTASDLKSADYSTDENNIFHIPRDESVKIDISKVGSADQDFSLFVKPTLTECVTVTTDSTHSGSGLNNSFIEAKITGTFDDGSFSEIPKIFATSLNKLGIKDTHSVVIYDTSDTGVYTISDIIASMAGAKLANAASAELTLKPVGCGVDIGISPDPTNGKIASPWTTIKSVGYYGDATRTLTANIDRQSGTVYDLFDFVVYKHS
jgi:hypothetical protein